MPRHKAATEVTLAKPDEGSEFGAWVDRNWKAMAAIAVLIAIAILAFQFIREQRREALAASWNRIWAHVEPGADLASFTGDAHALAAAYPDFEDTEAGPWALYLQAKIHANEREYDQAVAVLIQLQERYPDHPLVKERFPIRDRETPRTLVENLLQILRAKAAWVDGREHLFGNPPPPPDAPEVSLTTSEGEIVVQLYPELAPRHADNFLKLVREGFYEGTRFHRVEPGFMIQGGDPTTKEDDRSLWGTGGPGYMLEPEENQLRHFQGYLAAAKPGGSEESSGSQFYITVAPAHHLDGEHVVFGKVVRGMDVAHWIAGAELETNPMLRGQPVEPVAILSASIVQP
jgi:cyclophilin family peptidyl-prolyl cis-trans isomerase